MTDKELLATCQAAFEVLGTGKGARLLLRRLDRDLGGRPDARDPDAYAPNIAGRSLSERMAALVSNHLKGGL